MASCFVRIGDNKWINSTHIKWVSKNKKCYNICLKANGCDITDPNTMHKVCDDTEYFNVISNLLKDDM